MDDTPTKQDQQELDKTLKDTFPASDPPANSGTTGPGRTSSDNTSEKKGWGRCATPPQTPRPVFSAGDWDRSTEI